ncbi:DUF2789 family protein [uncultured Amphritea sp.]|uniref:DUF2789 family protein n=1 Tax=uncultured Amphritea sp. TaxID=981605 RepID=UPI0026047969|nr:DUF2789 family protein [uncultured Amphritea sp.]
MNYYSRELKNLFQQLGLENDSDSIDNFIDKNKIITEGIHIADAPCWTHSQSEFIRDSIFYDSEWSEPVDQLDIILRN